MRRQGIKLECWSSFGSYTQPHIVRINLWHCCLLEVYVALIYIHIMNTQKIKVMEHATHWIRNTIHALPILYEHLKADLLIWCPWNTLHLSLWYINAIQRILFQLWCKWIFHVLSKRFRSSALPQEICTWAFLMEGNRRMSSQRTQNLFFSVSNVITKNTSVPLFKPRENLMQKFTKKKSKNESN